jgi:nucleoside-diphosphate-sugar epimerase
MTELFGNRRPTGASGEGWGRPGQPYNVVDDEPVNWRDFTWALAEAFSTPRPLELPRVALRIIAPYLAVVRTSTLRVSNARARRELQWTPSIPDFRDGIGRMRAGLREAA